MLRKAAGAGGWQRAGAIKETLQTETEDEEEEEEEEKEREKE